MDLISRQAKKEQGKIDRCSKLAGWSTSKIRGEEDLAPTDAVFNLSDSMARFSFSAILTGPVCLAGL
jgi:hypothetical protein